MSKNIIIEVQHFKGCPNGPLMIKNVKEAIKDLDDRVKYSELTVDSNEIAQKIGFLGSPTLMINGEDFEGRIPSENPSMNCRLYINGVPESDEIKMRINNLLNC